MGGRGTPHGAMENRISGFRTFQNAGFLRFGLGLQKLHSEPKTHFQGLKHTDFETKGLSGSAPNKLGKMFRKSSLPIVTGVHRIVEFPHQQHFALGL